MISTFSGFLRDCAVALDMVRTFSQKDRNLFPGCYRVILPGFGGCYIMKEWDWDLRCFSMNPRTFHSSIVLLLAMCHIYTIYIYTYIHTSMYMHVKFKIIKYLCISIIYILYMYTNVLIYIYIVFGQMTWYPNILQYQFDNVCHPCIFKLVSLLSLSLS